jgi:putative salt-induced outer membrane protein YdiY
LLLVLSAAGAALAHDPEAEVAPLPPAGLFGTSFLEGWTRSIGAGVAGSEGNSKTFDLNADLLGDAEDEVRRWKLRSAYYISSADGDENKNQAYFDLTRDFLFPGWPVFLFGQGRFDYDKFEAWDYRLAGALGVGYDLYDSDPFDLRARIGVGVSQTFGAEDPVFGTDTDEFRPEGLAGIEAVWRPRDGQTFSTAHTIYPDLAGFDAFRTLSTVDWIIEVSDWIPLALKLGLIYEYESDPPPDSKSSDLKYAASLLYSF